MILAVPAPTPVTTPEASTVATPEASVDHVIVWLDAFAGVTDAVKVIVEFFATDDEPETLEIPVTGCVTVMVLVLE